MDAKSSLITPDELAATDRWLPSLFCGQAGRVARLAPQSRRIGEMATCLEGWRVSPNPDSPLHDPLADESPRYRQANIDVFTINNDGDHYRRPIVEDRPYCILPGDVIIPRIPPLRAAMASENNHRHPIDGNCFLTRGLKPTDAAWLLALFNEKEYEAWFVALSASQTLPRIGIRDLRNCPFPAPPADIGDWSRRLHDWLERYSFNSANYFALQANVSKMVDEFARNHEESERRLFPGGYAPAVLLSSDSWLPEHVENEYQQRTLDQKGWRPLRELVVNNRPASARLKDDADAVSRLLRLKDVENLYIPSIDATIPETRLGRFFAAPVRPGEILVSSLVTSSKIAYADPDLGQTLHPIDNWIRLNFRETPGAWALILATPALKAQFRRLAMGSALQFTNITRLLDFRVPNIERSHRIRWQTRLDNHLVTRRRLVSEWGKLRQEGREMAASVLDVPWNEMQERNLR